MARPLPSSVPALVTGASSGIGAEFARQLAARGHAVTLVARRTDRLEQLATELQEHHGADVTVVTADLETDTGQEEIARRLRHGPWLLVNNAGFGSHGRLDRLPAEREMGEVALNVVALHRLLLAVLPGNVRARGGGVINVASTAGFQPLPYMSTYSATKAFVLSITEGVATEVGRLGVRVMALCPGPVATEFGAVAHTEGLVDRLLPTMSSESCVRRALQAFDRGRTVCVPGLTNRATSVAGRLTPHSLVRSMAGRALLPR